MTKTKFKSRFLRSVLLMLIGSLPAAATIKLPAIFSDHMVLQQQSKARVWGWGKPGEKVMVTGSWSNKIVSTTTGADGQWKLLLHTPAAGGPYTLKIAGENSIVLQDVLIGEVWVCSGQSNMVFSLKASDKAAAEIALAALPAIRYYSVTRQYGPEEAHDSPGSVWQKTSPETAPSYSAVAYYFARKIHQQMQVPVGIVYAAWGGTPAEAWTPASTLQSDSALSAYRHRWQQMYVTVGKDSADWHQALAQWEQARRAGAGSKLRKPVEPATLISYNRPWREPAVLFNGMINPVIPFEIKGVLWYQGESNVSYAQEYYHLFSSMIKGWRQKWAKPKLPFYFVQIAPFAYSKPDAAAQLREAQYQVTQHLPNTGMAVTLDLGDMKDQHYKRKKEVGDRLALIALAKDYGFKKINYKGPEIKKASREKGKAVLEFESAAALKTDGSFLQGFEIGYRTASPDSVVFVKAQAKLAGNKIIVWHVDHQEPVAVRYAWLLAGEANLLDEEGLPAGPFRMPIKQTKGKK